MNTSGLRRRLEKMAPLLCMSGGRALCQGIRCRDAAEGSLPGFL